MKVDDQRSAGLPDGFSKNAGELDPFARISRGARDNFAKSSEEYDPWAEVESQKTRVEEIGESITESVNREMSPEMKKLLGLGLDD